ncbi:MAG: hypothetical protein JNM98_17450 [Rhodocyclaceae bacterium]|nr:hypothetical protein [Rhodocyclaceae bacterium]
MAEFWQRGCLLPLHTAYGGKPTPDGTRLGESRVACDCDPALHRDLLLARSELSRMLMNQPRLR